MERLQLKTLMTIITVGFLAKTTQALVTNTGFIMRTEGSSVTLNCDREDLRGVLSWRFGSLDNLDIVSVSYAGVIMKSDSDWKDGIGIDKDGTSLVIFNLKLERDDGTFYCSLQSNTVSIIVSVSVPVKTVALSHTDNSALSTLSTSPANFTCTVTSKPRASIMWYLVMTEGSTITLNPGPVTSSDVGKLTKVVSSLLYRPKREHDGGNIECHAQNIKTSDTKISRINLSIHFPPILEPEQTEVQSLSVVEKSPLVLKCTSWANPQTEFTWKHGNQTISHSIVNTDKDNNRRESTLTISNAKMTDAGLYICSARNEFQTAVSPGFNVTVQMLTAPANTGTNTDPSTGSNTDPSKGSNTDHITGSNTDPSKGSNTVAIAVGVAVMLVLIIAAIIVFVIIKIKRKKHDTTSKVHETVVFENNLTDMTRQNDINMTSDPGASYDSLVIVGDTVSMQQDTVRDGSPGPKYKASAPGIQNGMFKNGAEKQGPQCVEYESTENLRQKVIAQNKLPVNTAGLIYADLSHDGDVTRFPPPKPVRLGEQRGTEYATININKTDTPRAT